MTTSTGDRYPIFSPERAAPPGASDDSVAMVNVPHDDATSVVGALLSCPEPAPCVDDERDGPDRGDAQRDHGRS